MTRPCPTCERLRAERDRRQALIEQITLVLARSSYLPRRAELVELLPELAERHLVLDDPSR